MTVLHLMLPPRLDSARRLRRQLRGFLEHKQVPRREREDLVLAVHEVFANAILHSGQSRGGVDVSARVIGATASIEFRDRGRGFACGRHEGAGATPKMDPLRPSSRGLHLACLLTDELQIHHHAEGGVRVCLMKSVPTRYLQGADAST